MRPGLIAVPFILAAAAAAAYPAYDISRMSCAEVQAALRGVGQAVLHYRNSRNPSLPLYGRYVSDSRFCDPGTTATYASVPAADNPACTVRQCRQLY